MSDFIGIDITGEKAILTALEKLPEAIADEGVDAANRYLVDALKLYPSYQHVTRKRAYGQTFSSDKQRRYVMMMIRNGEITPGRPNRTQTFRQGWQIVGTGRKAIIANEVPYGKYLMGDDQQARQPMMVGWQRVRLVIADRMDGVMKKFNGAVKDAARKLGLT